MQSNNLTYAKSLTVNGYIYNVKIRLNDECKNGHQDFAITGNIYRIERNGRRVWESGGCLHDMIVDKFPQFKIFIDLHLCDYNGVPIHCIANMFYHIKQGFNSTPVNNPNFKDKFCKYYRITGEQFDSLAISENKVQFAMQFSTLGILQQWEKQAKEAIEILEQLTGKTFVNDSVKSNYIAPTEAEILEEIEKQKNGYYTPEQRAQRELQKIDAEFQKLYNEYQKDIAKCTEEYEVKKQVLMVGGAIALQNCIYYNHSKTVSFNWRGYSNLDETFVLDIISKLQLPEGVTAEISKKK